MTTKLRVVIDTNILVSAAFFVGGVPWKAVQTIFADHVPIFTEETFMEVKEVLLRSKFDRYASIEDRKSYLEFLAQNAVYVAAEKRVKLCRDPKDDKFLEAAINGHAQVLITGDGDLSVLGSLEQVDICSAKAFLENFDTSDL